jgi:hypothetical protein
MQGGGKIGAAATANEPVPIADLGSQIGHAEETEPSGNSPKTTELPGGGCGPKYGKPFEFRSIHYVEIVGKCGCLGARNRT